MIRVLLVDDHTLIRQALSKLLSSEPDVEVVGQSGSGREAVELCRTNAPDVVVLDYGLPDLDGLETTSRIVELEAGIRVLILTMHENEEYATRVIQAGASGFVVKSAPTNELLAGIRKVANGGVYVTSSVLEKMVTRIGKPSKELPESTLSNRELQVLIGLARGQRSREIAKELCISVSTVDTYRGRLLQKLELRNNSDLTRFAIRKGLIDAE